MISSNSEDQAPAIPPHRSTISLALNRIGKFCVSRLPKNWGFAILVFPFDGSEGLRFVSNGTRKDVVKLLKEFVEKQQHAGPNNTQREIPPEAGPGSSPGDSPPA